MNQILINKLKQLPMSAGVYFHKNSQGQIIYIGKAAILKNRVRQYFQKSTLRDAKTSALISEIADVEWMEVENEFDALFLESEMVKRYLPKYNILLRDDKSMVFIRIDIDSSYPTVSLTRRPMDDHAKYFGPYLNTVSINQALRFLRKIFPYARSRPLNQKRVSLDYHLGLDPGLEEGKTSLIEYRANLRKLIAVIEGQRSQLIDRLQKEMNLKAKNQEFEQAAMLRNQIVKLKSLNKQILFSDKEFMDISKDHALNELVQLFGLKTIPKRIEGYDISHMGGQDVVASMVVFSNGVSDRREYRKFKIKIDQNNDFFNISEALSRRLKSANIKAWGKPDFVIIDGGKGQLDAALKARDIQGLNIPFVGLAKKQEQIVFHKTKSLVSINDTELKKLKGYLTTSQNYGTINIPNESNIIKLFQRIRDESHRFAVSYHTVIKTKRQTVSALDDIPGIGPITRKLLLGTFKSLKSIQQASDSELQAIIGSSKTKSLRQYLD